VKRRELVLGFGCAIAASHAVRAWGQQPGRMYRIGSLFSAPRDAPHHLTLRAELRRAGFIEGENLTIDERGFGLSGAEFAVHATELVSAHVDVIMAGGDAAVEAAQRATSEIPILALTDDMVGKGFAQSLAKPGGNTTGVTILASELDGKRQEILLEAVPGARRIAALVDRNTSSESHVKALQEAARSAGIELSVNGLTRAEDIPAALDGVRSSGAEALNVLASALLFNNRETILERVATLRLPAIYQWPEMATRGGLIGYGPSIVQLYKDIQSRQLVRLLRGAKPGELPVEQPTKFELVINLKTAKGSGLRLSQSLLARADEVIE
jgi:putative tryptophan/tyrosine transport system substrate-binding protein